ncbi:MAG: hypothetical protein L6Q76_25105 [Polyangiaceae bacterium]|nr:hypothetical protein [Polyangiaceae bacterium]
MSRPSSPPAETASAGVPDEPRKGAPKDDPLIQAVLAAPPARRALTDDEKAALEEYRQMKRSARGA